MGRFVECVASTGLTLYRAQEQAILELFEDQRVILSSLAVPRR